MAHGTRLVAFALATLPLQAAAGDYVGVLKPPKSGLNSGSFFSIDATPALGSVPSLAGDNGFRIKLGYTYSRFFSVQGEFVDFGRLPSDVFGSPANTASLFRQTGYGVDTIATLPWRSFSFYGRLGAYRGDTRNAFAAYSTSLVGDATRGTRLRYGLGMRYDFTKAFGIRAELERYSPLGASLSNEAESDLFSVGLLWRF